MRQPAHLPKSDHPLVADRGRLDKITDNMYAQIHKVIYGRRPDPGTERVLHGGESADDILQEALFALLEYDPSKLRTTWEALSVGIARKKAFAGLRRATRGRRAGGTDGDDPDHVTVVALDGAIADPRDDCDDHDPEQAFEKTQQQLVLLQLARERLSDREQTVFFGIHFYSRTRAALAKEIGLTPQAVGQMYVRVAKALHTAACKDPAFPTTTGTPEGRAKWEPTMTRSTP